MEDQCVITREITVAGGVFAPGHLGELTQIVPFEMVDQALAADQARPRRRIRVLPSRVVVYLLLAGCLFAGAGLPGQVWHKLTAGLGGLPVASPGDERVVRRPAPGGRRAAAVAVRPAARPGHGDHRAGAVRWWRGLLVCAIDGTTLTVPDSPANLDPLHGKQAGNHGGIGYPQLRLVALVACGTRTLIDAVFGPASCGETGPTPAGLRRSLHGPACSCWLDRNFDAAALLGQLAATEAQPVWSAWQGATASCRYCAATATDRTCRRSAPSRCG